MTRGKREQRGSTPGRSHPRQITICTRHLRAELSANGQKMVSELGEWGPVLSGCSQVFLSGCQSYCIHHSSLCHVQSMVTKTLHAYVAYFFLGKNQDHLMHNQTVLSAATTTFICVYVWINELNRLWQMCLKLNCAWKVNGKSVETLAQSIEWQKKDSGLDLQVSKINHRAKTALIYHPDGRKGINKFLRRT